MIAHFEGKKKKKKKNVIKCYVFRMILNMFTFFYFYFLNIRCENSHKFLYIFYLDIISNKLIIFIFCNFKIINYLFITSSV